MVLCHKPLPSTRLEIYENVLFLGMDWCLNSALSVAMNVNLHTLANYVTDFKAVPRLLGAQET